MMNAEKLKTALCYFAIYFIWGTGYLCTRFVLETLPPFFAAGARFTSAGCILILCALIKKGVTWPTRENWIHAAKVGAMAFSLSFGLTALAQTVVPSSVTALIIALEPIWFVIFDWLFFKGPRPTARIAAAQAIGFAGCALLILADPDPNLSMKGPYILWVCMILAGNLCWTYGALYSRGGKAHKDPLLTSGMQMFCGGAALLAMSAIAEDPGGISGVSVKSILSLCYLILFGSIVAYSSYVYLLRSQPLAKVAAHAFVNPIVAVIMGWALAGERVTASVLIAAALIVVSVIMTIYGGRGRKPERR